MHFIKNGGDENPVGDRAGLSEVQTNTRKIGIEGREDSQLKKPVSIFNKLVEENFPNIK